MAKSNAIMFRNKLGLKRESEISCLNNGQGKVQKLALKKDGSGFTNLPEDNINILSNVIIKKQPGYEVISEGTADENSILFNMLSQSQSDEIICLQQEQSSGNGHLGAAPVYPSIPIHYDGAPSSSALAEECNQLQRSLRMGGKNMRLLAKMVGEPSKAVKVPSALDADVTCVVPGEVDLHAAKDLVCGMIENLNNLKQKYEDGVEVETAILAELEAQADKQRAKVAALIEGVNYLKNITDAVTAFELV